MAESTGRSVRRTRWQARQEQGVALLTAGECHSGAQDAQLSPRRHRWGLEDAPGSNLPRGPGMPSCRQSGAASSD